MNAEEMGLLDSSESGALSVDEALDIVGGFSKYQHRLMLYLGAAIAASSAHMLVPIFLIPRMMASWQLSAGASSLQSSVFFLGYIIGVFFWAGVSDSRGRRPATTTAFALGNLSGIASFFAPNYLLFVMLRCVCGIGIAGAKNGCFILATELAPPAARSRVGALISYAWFAGLLYLVATAWMLQHLHWRWLVLAYVPAIGVQAILSSAIPESPRYLLVCDQKGTDGPDMAKQVLLSVFKANGRSPPEPFTLRRPPATADSHDSLRAGSSRGRDGAGGPAVGGGANASTFAQLWQPGVRRQTAVVGFCQGVCTMVFYALTFDPRANAAAGDLYLGALLGALVELPAYALLAPLTNGLGRKTAYSFFLALSALCLFALHLALAADDAQPSARAASAAAGRADGAAQVAKAAMHQANWQVVAYALGGRFASVAATNVAYIVAAEVYPTTCRNSAVGWGTGCGRVGAIVAPALMLGMDQPLILFVALSLIASALVWLLPETAGVRLADVRSLGRGRCSTPELESDEKLSLVQSDRI